MRVMSVKDALALAMEHHQRNELGTAEAIYRGVLDVRPDNADALHMLGVVASQTGRHELSVRLLEAALTRVSSHIVVHNLSRSLFEWSRQLAAEGRPVEAIASLERLVALVPEHQPALFNLGTLLQERNRLGEAAARFGRLFTLKPDDGDVLWRLAVLDLLMGRTEDAIAHGRHLVALWPDFATAYVNLATAFKRHGSPGDAIACLRRALTLDPTLVEPRYNLANIFFGQQDYAAAAAELEICLALRPDMATAHGRLGMCRFNQGDPVGAEADFRRAAVLAPDDGDTFSNLGIMLKAQDRTDEAIEAYGQALRLQPDNAVYHYNLGLTLEAVGRIEDAAAAHRIAVARDPSHIGAHHILGRLLLLQGNLAEGGAEYEWRPNNVSFRQHAGNRHGLPFWDGRPLPGKTLLLMGEGGIGDVIQFIRYAPLALDRCEQVAVLYQRDLTHLLATLPGGDRIQHNPARVEQAVGSAMLLSLPHLMGTTLDTIPASVPYLFADPERVAAWRRAIADAPGLRVGLAWETRGDRQRSLPVARLLEALSRVPGITLFSLQKGGGAAELAALPVGERAGIRCPAIDEGTDIFKDTAALMMNLDLVISIDTAAAHLAGALGRPVWVLLNAVPDWRWLLDREDSPWYPTMRLFRQRRIGDWGPVLDAVADHLSRLAADPAKGSPMPLLVPVSWGELIDKITILEIKAERIADPAKLANVRRELGELAAVRDGAGTLSAEAAAVTGELRAVNAELWDIEDDIRDCERGGDFGRRFVELARAVYRTNDRRAALKRRLNDLLGSELVEEKSYQPY